MPEINVSLRKDTFFPSEFGRPLGAVRYYNQTVLHSGKLGPNTSIMFRSFGMLVN